jgi:hypothetical protein
VGDETTAHFFLLGFGNGRIWLEILEVLFPGHD